VQKPPGSFFLKKNRSFKELRPGGYARILHRLESNERRLLPANVGAPESSRKICTADAPENLSGG
jgi:hypothetical protein